MSVGLAAVACGLIPATAYAAPQPCNRASAYVASAAELEPYAHRTYRRYWGRIGPARDWRSSFWSLHRVYCRDLTNDGQAEMIVHWYGPTGASLFPWAIFKRDEAGEWRLAYGQVRDQAVRLRLPKGAVREQLVAVYDGAFTTKYRNRTVRWNGKRFVSKLGPVYEIHNPNVS